MYKSAQSSKPQRSLTGATANRVVTARLHFIAYSNLVTELPVMVLAARLAAAVARQMKIRQVASTR